MKTAVLTSSRADYGIYLPLLKKMEADCFFDLHLLVFGTHLSERFGKTIGEIEKNGFRISARLNTTPEDDIPGSISRSMANTIKAFSAIWENEDYDLVIALGDRYEMFAAVTSLMPFNIPVAHIHGGETTQGAFDNAFRHSITHMSVLHFTAAEEYRKRVAELKGSDENIYNTGALAIDLLSKTELLTVVQIKEIYKIDMTLPTILVTFHPETMNYSRNRENVSTLIDALSNLSKYQLVISMPNADTSGMLIREHLNAFISKNMNAIGVENLGSTGYLSCMKYCSFLLGNSSSGFIEASWFPKPVINIGRRQEGRILTPNIYSCKIDTDEILAAVRDAEMAEFDSESGIYGDGDASGKMIKQIKRYFKTEDND